MTKKKQKKLFTLKEAVEIMFEGEVIGEEINPTKRKIKRQKYFKKRFNVVLPPLNQLK